MYVKVQDNKTLLVTVPTTIFRGETGADTLTFLIPQTYEGLKVADCSVMLRYIRADQVGHSEELKLIPEMYNGYLQYAIAIDTDVTSEAGDVRLWLSCISYEDAVIFKTGELTINVLPSPEIEKYLPMEDLDQLDRLEVAVKTLEDTKADNLLYDSSAGSIQLSAAGKPIGDEVIAGDGAYSIIDGGGAAQ